MTKSKFVLEDSVNFERTELARSIRQQLSLPRAFALAAIAIATPVFSQSFPASIELSELDGSNGFIFKRNDRGDLLGQSVSAAGDVNGDGVGDLIISAPNADPNGNNSVGEIYVVFGGSGVGDVIEPPDLDSNNGFVINGGDGADTLIGAGGNDSCINVDTDEDSVATCG